MKLLLIIDHVGLGGAQRQMVELACGLKRRGHEVQMFTYFSQYDFFRPLLQEHGVFLHEYSKNLGFSTGVLGKLTSLMRKQRFDIVLAYLSSPTIYAELASIVTRKSKLVVSERVGHHHDKSPVRDFLRRALHVIADKVVANSRTHCEWLKRKWWLKDKSVSIYNGLNLDLFHPQTDPSDATGGLNLIAIGRVGPQKNILNLIAALSILSAEGGGCPQVSWVGQQDEDEVSRSYRAKIDEALEAQPEVRGRWHWLGMRADVPSLLREHDALIHPSFYEGLPNVVCEALASGLPVLASNVCDHPLLVADGERGFLFDPSSPREIASAIKQWLGLAAVERRRVRLNARQYAVTNLGVERMVSEYELLFRGLVGG